MFLHLGKDTVVNTKNIISFFDLESASMSRHTRSFLKIMEEEGFIRNVADTEIPKSFVVCEIDGQSVVYITNISTRALVGRVNR